MQNSPAESKVTVGTKENVCVGALHVRRTLDCTAFLDEETELILVTFRMKEDKKAHKYSIRRALLQETG